MLMKNPPHPGRFVYQEFIEPLGLTISDAAICARRDADVAIGIGQRQARHIS